MRQYGHAYQVSLGHDSARFRPAALRERGNRCGVAATGARSAESSHTVAASKSLCYRMSDAWKNYETGVNGD